MSTSAEHWTLSKMVQSTLKLMADPDKGPSLGFYLFMHYAVEMFSAVYYLSYYDSDTFFVYIFG